MRNIVREQMRMGEVDISAIEIDRGSRDEIPDLLIGLQHLYADLKVRHDVFAILKDMVPPDVSVENGREGMTLWQILVLGTLRLCCNWDYDKLREIADNHRTLRQILGHGILDTDRRYPRQTLCDNIHLFTPAILERINRVVVGAGHKVIGVGSKVALEARCDSFVVETDVHFPTDLNLLWDAARKVMTLTHQLSRVMPFDGWRQTRHNLLIVKRLYRAAQKQRERDKDSEECLRATRRYIDEAGAWFGKAKACLTPLLGSTGDILLRARIDEIFLFARDGETLIDQIERRCFKGETIPHGEKMFSLFQRHTEWISKGKAGVPQELGLRVCIMEDSEGFVLSSRVMIRETDDQVAVPMVEETKKRYPNLARRSFDKGFHSPQNQKDLAEILTDCVMPKKGRLDSEEQRREDAPVFRRLRRSHSAVESGINALENHGLDVCPDDGIDGFRRYVGLAVVARNIQLLGRKIREKETEERDERRCVRRKAA